jgi:hypothetical protein
MQSLGQDLNLGYPEFKAGVLTTQLLCSIQKVANYLQDHTTSQFRRPLPTLALL